MKRPRNASRLLSLVRRPWKLGLLTLYAITTPHMPHFWYTISNKFDRCLSVSAACLHDKAFVVAADWPRLEMSSHVAVGMLSSTQARKL